MSTPSTMGELTVAPNIPAQSTIDKITTEANTLLMITMESISVKKDVSTETTALVCREQALAPLSVVLSRGQFAARDIAVPADAARTLAVEGWGRNALMVEGIFRIIENMEPPWITLNVLEAAALQFPTVDKEVLCHTIMMILMSQRCCVVRLTRAGLRLGPRMDREGNAFVELDLDYADRYSNSH